MTNLTKEIANGDVVKTPQHNLLMTVESINSGVARCVYFNKDENGDWNELLEEDYSIEELEFVR